MQQLHHQTKNLIAAGCVLIAFIAITRNPIVRPTPVPRAGNWSIQLMQHPLLFGLAGHNYLSLRDHDRKIVSELHGLATDTSTNSWKYVGTNIRDVLRVWHFNGVPKYISNKNYPGIIIAEGTEEDMSVYWERGVMCGDMVNAQHIPYPPLGISFRGDTENSNSVAYTLALCMGLNPKHLGLITPGWGKNLLGTDSR